ncbi:hypothetical protein CI109_104195 [Kwoniella shandongensis]|uniref:Uncharacterized protein n=1 Tax=Kwoniella shandongensis TaxID=1734106 RepID=A0A5M6C0R6_9TREE|nr:uncharacterized protein CI109_002894 [Kwoniella shandongensis]KAA5528736.1 hypothetical protein CI109_002894 [Kwoniella shandongensis]
MSSSREQTKPSSSSSKTPKSSSSKSSSKKDSSSSSSKDKAGPSASQSKSVDQIRNAEYEALVQSCLASHAGYLHTPIGSLSSLLSLPQTTTLIILLSLFLFAHFYFPLFLIPHLSSTITLIIPIQNTVAAIQAEKDDKGKKGEAGQWLLYWMIYCFLGWGRGWVAIYRPGWRGVFEVGRSGGLVLLGGGWFGRAVLKQEKSKGLKEAEQRESQPEKKDEGKAKPDGKKKKSEKKAESASGKRDPKK